MSNLFNNKFKYLSQRKPRRFSWSFIIIAVIIIYMIVVLFLPMPKISPSPNNFTPQDQTGKLIWPTLQSQSAVGAVGYGVLATNGEQKPAAIASIAKTMVALMVLEKKPLKLGEPGPTITMTAQDEEYFREDLAQNGSVVPVKVGEELTEYQMLQALLLPSGDNIASTLAVWGFGSLDGYLTYANQKAAEWNLTQTHFADASGLLPETQSSAYDLIILGEKLMSDPVLAEIVNQSDVTLPLAGNVFNYNTILGEQNIVGIKTGNTDEAGGCFLFASKRSVGGKEVTILGVILGSESRNQALTDTKKFLQTNNTSFAFSAPVVAGQVVGSYKLPWGKTVDVVAKDDLQVLTVPGQKISVQTNLSELNQAKNKGSVVGEVLSGSGSTGVKTPAVLAENIKKPPFFWRLLHPLK